jgi:hypothetical protein
MSGFPLFCGFGLPSETAVFLDGGRGFLFDKNSGKSPAKATRLKSAEDIWRVLRWRRFGQTVLVVGEVKECDAGRGLFCLTTAGGREQWCRVADPRTVELPPPGSEVEIFAWTRWLGRVLDVIEVKTRL